MNAEMVNKRKRKYTGQVLGKFEREIEPHLDLSDPAVRRTVNTFKADLRDKFERLAEDGIDFMTPGTLQNGEGLHLRDRLGERRRAPEPIGAAAA